jgi:hypothetical protein
MTEPTIYRASYADRRACLKAALDAALQQVARNREGLDKAKLNVKMYERALIRLKHEEINDPQHRE